MAGILDSKSRILDAILTSEGRRQVAEGTFIVSCVTFTDADIAYIPDAVDGHVDPTGKIYFEACNLPQDQIVFEANDGGKLIPFRHQDIKLETSNGVNGNVSGSSGQGNIVNGRLVVYQFQHGRTIKVSDIFQDSQDLNKGFIYSDSSGVTGSILINPQINAGLITSSISPGGPYVVYVGTKNGMGSAQFAESISSAISTSKSSGGPSVTSFAQNDSVYLDGGDDNYFGTILQYSGTLSSPIVLEEAAIGGNQHTDELTNAIFASQITGLLTSSFDNYKKLQSISTIDKLFMDDSFEISSNEINFDITQIKNETFKTLKVQSKTPPDLNAIDSLFNDNKMSHLDNFKYLPPIVKVSDSIVTDKSNIQSIQPYLLGNYPSWGDNEKTLSYSGLLNELQNYPKQDILFWSTSNKNNIIAQIFEVSENTVHKLDIVDFGKIKNDTQDPTVVSNRVFFAGKTFIDNRGTTCYVNMFSIIFSKRKREFV